MVVNLTTTADQLVPGESFLRSDGALLAVVNAGTIPGQLPGATPVGDKVYCYHCVTGEFVSVFKSELVRKCAVEVRPV